MHTIVRIDVCAPLTDRDTVFTAMDLAFERIAEIGWRMNVYDEKSDVQKINQLSPHQQIQIPEDTFLVLDHAKEVYELTDGAFNIGVWPLIQYWKDKEKNQIDPSTTEINQLATSLSLNNLILTPPSQVTRTNNQLELDLGGIAKGYAIDEAVRILRSMQLNNFQVDAGGDLYVSGLNCYNEKWRIGIRNPKNTDQLLDILEVSNVAITTSGNYERYFLINDQKYSHILNPLTGFPQQNILSASVVATSAMKADAYTTAFTILPLERTRKLVKKDDDLVAFSVVLDNNGENQKVSSPEYESLSQEMK